MTHYETTDIFLGAYLLSGISFNSRQIATFIFSRAGLYQLDHEYRAGTALVNLVSLQDSLSEKREQRGKKKCGEEKDVGSGLEK